MAQSGMEQKSTTNNYFLAGKSRIRVSDLQEAKLRGEKWAMLTSYDSTSAKIFDQAGIPCLLIGDSAAQTVLGYKSTIPITVDELIPLCRAVSSSCKRALVVADLPFGSYQESPQAALRAATRFMKEAQVHAVKLEGGVDYVEHIQLLSRSGIPVMAHIGFTPQSEHALSGFKIQGRDPTAPERMSREVQILEGAGAFACVVELVPSEVGKEMARNTKIPIIGIGAGPHCDAQVMVWQDMAGFNPPQGNTVGYLGGGDDNKLGSTADVSGDKRGAFTPARVPKFVKKYANIGELLFEAAISYAKDVSSGAYPAEEHCYK